MKRRNCRFLWALLLLLLATQACWRDAETVKRRYVASGDRYFAQGKYKEASLMYQNALRKDQRFGEAYAKLGESELRRGDPQNALRAFTRATELLGKDENPPSRAADIYLAYYGTKKGHTAATLKQVDDLASLLLKRNPDSYNGLRLTGFLELAKSGADESQRQAHLDAAIASFRKADQARPNQPDLLFALAQTLNRRGEWGECEALVKRLLDRNPQYWPPYDFLVYEYLRRNRPQDAEQVILRKVKNDPKNPDFVIEEAGFYLAMQRKDQVEAVLKSLLAREMELPEARKRVGDFYMRSRDFDRAIAMFQEGANQGGDRVNEYRMQIAIAQIATRRTADAMQTVGAILKDDPKNDNALSLRAGLQLDSGDAKLTQSAINDLQMLIGRLPKNYAIRYNLARAYHSLGEHGYMAARIQYQEAVRLRPDFLAAQLGLAQVNLSLSDFTHASESANDALKIDPNNILAMAIKANAQINLHNLVQARTDLHEQMTRYPNSPDLQFQLALLDYAEKKFPESEALLRKMLEKYPGDARLTYAVADIMVRTNRGKDAVKMLQDQLTRTPQNQAMRYALANTAASPIVGEYDLAEREYRKLMEVMPNNFDLLLKLGETVYKKGNAQQAMDLLRQALALDPKNKEANLFMALTMESVGMKKEAYPYYQKVLAADPGQVVALNNVAFLLAEEGHDLDSALTFIQKAKQQLADNDDISDTMGWVYLKRSMTDDALVIFRDIVKRNPNKALFRYHLAAALFQKKDNAGAKQSLQAALALKPSKDEEKKIRELLAKIG